MEKKDDKDSAVWYIETNEGKKVFAVYPLAREKDGRFYLAYPLNLPSAGPYGSYQVAIKALTKDEEAYIKLTGLLPENEA